jgi:hypothetical protein
MDTVRESPCLTGRACWFVRAVPFGGHLNRELHALNRRGGPNGEAGGGDGGVGWRRRDRHRHDAGGLVACSTYGQTHRARTGIRLGPLRFQAGRAGD